MKYLQPDSPLTLAQGLTEYYASHEGLVRGRSVSEAASRFFRCHDAAHVVFGCDTTLVNELVVKISSFFGTTGGFGLLRDYALPESQEIYERLAWREIAVVTLRAAVLVPLVVWRCLRMHRRWPWSDFGRYMDVPLAEIRREFGIRLVRP